MRRVDDRCELVDTVHSQVGDGECTALVLFGLEFTVSGFGSERFSLGRDGGETLGSDVLDDRSDEAGRGGDSDTDIGAFVPGVSAIEEHPKSV